MSDTKILKFFLITLLFITHISCNKKISNLAAKSEVRIDTVFTKKFDLRSPGFTGGDATYSVLLPDGRTVWIFGDTFIGEVSPELTRIKTNPMYIRNCFVIEDEQDMKTLHKGDPKDFISMTIPIEVENGSKSELEVWYWPGDGIVHDNKLKVFMSKFHQANEGMWGFEFVETTLAEYSLPDIKEVNQIEIPYSKQSGIHFGHALFQSEKHLYIYGLKDKNPYVARTALLGDISKNWEFYTGESWDTDISKIQPMLDIDGSEQFSVIKLRNKYVLLTQLGSLSKTVCSLISDTPFGPWRNKQELFETPIAYNNEEVFTYNALAHPQFTENDEILVSYNTNSMTLEDHFTNAGIYRPRFMRVPINLIFQQ